jgi:hypothetical protein
LTSFEYFSLTPNCSSSRAAMKYTVASSLAWQTFEQGVDILSRGGIFVRSGARFWSSEGYNCSNNGTDTETYARILHINEALLLWDLSSALAWLLIRDKSKLYTEGSFLLLIDMHTPGDSHLLIRKMF